MNKIVPILSLVAILALVNWSIFTKENQLANGKVVYLELAPVDPRSLMQGDYMALRFGMGNVIRNALPKAENNSSWRHEVDASDGYVIVRVDETDVASYVELYVDQTLADNELLLRYRVRNGEIKFATNAFFFQEGHAKYYESARYGQFRVNDKGELLLVAMYNKDLIKLRPVSEKY